MHDMLQRASRIYKAWDERSQLASSLRNVACIDDISQIRCWYDEYTEPRIRLLELPMAVADRGL